MKRIKIMLFVGLIYWIFQVNLFSVISSRVEGIITDKDTGIPIEGVKVKIFLYASDFDLDVLESKTDKKGYFKFEFDDNGEEYYVQCEKEGYIPFVPKYYHKNLRRHSPDIFKKIVNVFYLKEGQIKHLKISLEKGGTLKGRIFKKDASGLSPYIGISINLNRDRAESDNNIFPIDINKFFMTNPIFTNENGDFTITGLEPFVYNILIASSGYPRNEIKGIEINKNEIKSIEYTVDLTNPTGIKGTIKINNTIPSHGGIGLKIIGSGEINHFDICNSNLNNNGEYSCLGLPAGKYFISISCFDVNSIYYEKEFEIEIFSGETKILNMNLNDGDKYEK